MQILLILVLMCNIYSGCVIYKAILKPDVVTVFVIGTPKTSFIISTIHLNNKSPHKSGNEKSRHSSEIYSRPCFIQRFATNKSGQVKTEKLILQRRCYKNARSNSRLHFRTSISSRAYQRKLLGHEQIFRKYPAKHRTSHTAIYREISAARKSRSRDRTRDDVAKETELEDKDIDPEAWDSWNNWSACSVTCGQGRQVRWRHCLSQNCTKGLKKAQIKSCHMEDCKNQTKSFLSWLGIKH